MQPQNEDAGISTTLEITEVFFFSLFGLGFGQSHLRSHLISEATRISDKKEHLYNAWAEMRAHALASSQRHDR